MSETTIIWLFGILGAWNVGLTLTIASMKLHQVKMQVALDMFIESLGEKMSKILHSPDDHLGLDELLDKYIDQHYDLTMQEWIQLAERCREVTTFERATKTERLMAGILAAVCEHKLQLYGIRAK